jgi:putative hydrolase of the HAD superfamily
MPDPAAPKAPVPSAAYTHILIDFFGTLVDYSASRTEQGYADTYELVRELGATVDYDGFLAAWAGTCAEFDRLSDRDDREFSMNQAGAAFLAGVLGREPAAAEVHTFVDRYVAEWNTGVRYPDGVGDLVRHLASAYRLAVVTNTHHTPLVPAHLAAMGLSACFDAVVMSVEVGWRKPHPAIYAAALDAVGAPASAAIFVGDTYGPDYEGPRRAGIRAYLIDPAGRWPVPNPDRLRSVLDLPQRLSRG